VLLKGFIFFVFSLEKFMAKPLKSSGPGTDGTVKTFVYSGIGEDVFTRDDSNTPVLRGTKSNDYLYINAEPSTPLDDSPRFDGGTQSKNGGADQIILNADDLTVNDTFFDNLANFEVLKFWNNPDGVTLGTEVVLGSHAENAGIREVTGSKGDDVISADAYIAGISIDGGEGADTITGGSGADTITGGSGADLLVGGGGTDTFLYTGAGQTGTVSAFATAAKTLDTTSLDILTVVNVDNDLIDLSALIGDIDSLSATVSAVGDGASVGASGEVQTYTGTWSGGVFTSTDIGSATDLLVVYDNDGVAAGSTYEAFVLLGVTSATITNGVIQV
jgi:Ca2+-binding RTX toxin-like protein